MPPRACSSGCAPRISRLLKTYDPDRAGLPTWLSVVSRSCAIDHLRRRRQPTEAIDDVPEAFLGGRRSSCREAEDPRRAPDGPPGLVLKCLYDEERDVMEVAQLLSVDAQTFEVPITRLCRGCVHISEKKTPPVGDELRPLGVLSVQERPMTIGPTPRSDKELWRSLASQPVVAPAVVGEMDLPPGCEGRLSDERRGSGRRRPSPQTRRCAVPRLILRISLEKPCRPRRGGWWFVPRALVGFETERKVPAGGLFGKWLSGMGLFGPRHVLQRGVMAVAAPCDRDRRLPGRRRDWANRSPSSAKATQPSGPPALRRP